MATTSPEQTDALPKRQPHLISHGPEWVMCVDQMLAHLCLPARGLRGPGLLLATAFLSWWTQVSCFVRGQEHSSMRQVTDQGGVQSTWRTWHSQILGAVIRKLQQPVQVSGAVGEAPEAHQRTCSARNWPEDTTAEQERDPGLELLAPSHVAPRDRVRESGQRGEDGVAVDTALTGQSFRARFCLSPGTRPPGFSTLRELLPAPRCPAPHY
ncbi:uncharacterized protein RBU33_013001 isoform 1-T1 [Hipposideros larvatus]